MQSNPPSSVRHTLCFEGLWFHFEGYRVLSLGRTLGRTSLVDFVSGAMYVCMIYKILNNIYCHMLIHTNRSRPQSPVIRPRCRSSPPFFLRCLAHRPLTHHYLGLAATLSTALTTVTSPLGALSIACPPPSSLPVMPSQF